MFVNPSESGRTVVKVIIIPPTGITESPVVWGYDSDYQKASALLPNHEKTEPFPIPELLLGAIDIPPHQSQNKWVAYFLDYQQAESVGLGDRNFPVYFAFHDVLEKPLGSPVEIQMTLATLKKIGGYSIESNKTFPGYKYRSH